MSEALINKGVTIVGNSVSKERPIVVIGCARGGTSMVAGALAKLGVFMGDKASAPVYEDVRLAESFEANRDSQTAEIVNEYSTKYTKWGWKRPSAINNLDKVDELLNSPLYIFIFKDVLSIAQRNSISMLSEISPMIRRALNEYSICLDFIERVRPCGLLISYDKVLSHPENFIRSLIDFYQLTPTENQINDAIRFVEPNPSLYLDSSRITKAHGRLGGINGRTIFGWAKYVHINKVAIVDFFINDQRIGSSKADQFREDINEKYGQACAFSFIIPEEILLSKGDVLRARVKDEVVDLENSRLELR